MSFIKFFRGQNVISFLRSNKNLSHINKPHRPISRPQLRGMQYGGLVVYGDVGRYHGTTVKQRLKLLLLKPAGFALACMLGTGSLAYYVKANRKNPEGLAKYLVQINPLYLVVGANIVVYLLWKFGSNRIRHQVLGKLTVSNVFHHNQCSPMIGRLFSHREFDHLFMCQMLLIPYFCFDHVDSYDAFHIYISGGVTAELACYFRQALTLITKPRLGSSGGATAVMAYWLATLPVSMDFKNLDKKTHDKIKKFGDFVNIVVVIGEVMPGIHGPDMFAHIAGVVYGWLMARLDLTPRKKNQDD